MRKIILGAVSIFVAIVLCFGFCSCEKTTEEQVELPADVDIVANRSQPLLKVYDVESKAVVEMQMEEYLLGVLAGEIYNDWPIEALKAQAILARTYALFFVQNNQGASV